MFTNSKHEKAEQALKKGDIDRSIKLYTEALNEAPNDCNILSDRAVAFLHKKDKLRCLADFNLAAQLDPDYAYRYASRAFAKQHFGDLDGAVEDYKKAVELDPDDAVANNNLGMLLEQQGYQKEAQERFERADKLSKMEDHLYAMMDEMEKSDVPSDSPQEEQPEVKGNVEDIREDDASSASKELKKVLTSRAQFKEFMRFVRNGFKLK